MIQTLAYIQAGMLGIMGILGIGFGLYGMVYLHVPLASLGLVAGVFALFFGVPTSLMPPFGYSSWREWEGK